MVNASYTCIALLILPFILPKTILADSCIESTNAGLYKTNCFSTEHLFSNFDKKPRNQTPLPMPLINYFFVFDDHSIGGTTRIINGVEGKNASGLYQPLFSPNSGAGDSSYGLSIEFEIGDTLPNSVLGNVTTSGFAGFGFNVYDSSTTTYFDQKSTGDPGLSFDYLCSEVFSEVTIEILDYYDVEMKKNRTVSLYVGKEPFGMRSFLWPDRIGSMLIYNLIH